MASLTIDYTDVDTYASKKAASYGRKGNFQGVDSDGERTIISSGYENCEWNSLAEIENFDSLIIDRYSIKYIKEELRKKILARSL